MKIITILIPCYNEEASLPYLYEELKRLMSELSNYAFELLFVNDGSKDRSLELLKQFRETDDRVNYVDLSRNFGKEKGMLAGFDYATGDCLVIMDADLQHPPKIIKEMVAKWEQGYDDVYAKRMSRGKEPWLRRKFSLLFYNVLKRTSKIDILPNVGDFRLLDRKCVESLKLMRESERYTKGMFCWIGYRKAYVEFYQQERKAGTSSWNFRGLLSLAIEGIVSFTTFPLRLATIVGIFSAAATFIYMIYVLFKTILWGDPVAGYPTLVLLILFFGGLQLMALGIIGEYMGRVFIESKHRPVYIVREYNGKEISKQK